MANASMAKGTPDNVLPFPDRRGSASYPRSRVAPVIGLLAWRRRRNFPRGAIVILLVATFASVVLGTAAISIVALDPGRHLSAEIAPEWPAW